MDLNQGRGGERGRGFAPWRQRECEQTWQGEAAANEGEKVKGASLPFLRCTASSDLSGVLSLTEQRSVPRLKIILRWAVKPDKGTAADGVLIFFPGLCFSCTSSNGINTSNILK